MHSHCVTHMGSPFLMWSTGWGGFVHAFLFSLRSTRFTHNSLDWGKKRSYPEMSRSCPVFCDICSTTRSEFASNVRKSFDSNNKTKFYSDSERMIIDHLPGTAIVPSCRLRRRKLRTESEPSHCPMAMNWRLHKRDFMHGSFRCCGAPFSPLAVSLWWVPMSLTWWVKGSLNDPHPGRLSRMNVSARDMYIPSIFPLISNFSDFRRMTIFL